MAVEFVLDVIVVIVIVVVVVRGPPSPLGVHCEFYQLFLEVTLCSSLDIIDFFSNTGRTFVIGGWKPTEASKKNVDDDETLRRFEAHSTAVVLWWWCSKSSYSYLGARALEYTTTQWIGDPQMYL